MREIFEFRIPEDFACEWLEPSDGSLDKLTKLVRIVRAEPNTPCFERIRHAVLSRRKSGDWFYASWNVKREYSKAELNSARVFRVRIRSIFEPCGEDLDVGYFPNSRPAEFENRIGPLVLQCAKLKGTSLSRSIAGEIVVAPRLQQEIQSNNLTGLELLPITCKGQNTESAWSELHVVAPKVVLSHLTLVGSDPFGEWSPLRIDINHIEKNILSEIYVKRESFHNSDFATSEQIIGKHRGLLRPQRVLFISQHAYSCLSSTVKRGLHFEIAHLE